MRLSKFSNWRVSFIHLCKTFEVASHNDLSSGLFQCQQLLFLINVALEPASSRQRSGYARISWGSSSSGIPRYGKNKWNISWRQWWHELEYHNQYRHLQDFALFLYEYKFVQGFHYFYHHWVDRSYFGISHQLCINPVYRGFHIRVSTYDRLKNSNTVL